MKKSLLLCTHLLILLLFLACGEETTTEVAPVTPTSEVNNQVPIITPTGDERYLNTKSKYIFDQDKLHTFELTLPEASLAKIDQDPAAEEYVEGSLTFEGETISPVGIRYKGSVGAFVNCLSGGNWANPSGRKICTKLSMKIKINWNGSDRQFYGLKKLQFHSQNNDKSQMRDRLGYWLFRKMEVPAPRAVHAKLMINGQYSGLYSLVEQIDGRFTRQNFDDGTGNLYKEVWPLTADGQPQTEATYLAGLKTNEDENPSVEIIQTFAEEIARATEAEVPTVIEKWMNVPEIISYIAVDRTIRNDDGAFHWYCNGGDCSSHNFYWYEEPTQKSVHLIPWDLDNAFENIITDANPVTPIADEWGAISANCEPFRNGFLGLRQRSAACDKLTKGWTTYETLLAEKLQELSEGPMSREKMDEKLTEWAEQIRAATELAADQHSDAVSVDSWESAMQLLRTQLDVARLE
ncbi:MAG: CotH kinase family protein [Bacteroidota bacterium]